jgi:hypothetical protein
MNPPFSLASAGSVLGCPSLVSTHPGGAGKPLVLLVAQLAGRNLGERSPRFSAAGEGARNETFPTLGLCGLRLRCQLFDRDDRFHRQQSGRVQMAGDDMPGREFP